MPHKRSKEKKELRKKLWNMRKELASLPKIYDPQNKECISIGYSWSFNPGVVLFGPRNYEDPFLKKMRRIETIVEGSGTKEKASLL